MEEVDTDPPYGIYGWKKRCLYLLLLILLVIVTANVTIVLWIVKILQVSTNGVKNIQMVGSGIQLSGKTFIHDSLILSRVFTRRPAPISFHCAENLTMRTTDHSGTLASNFYLGHGKFVVNTPTFKVSDHRGKTVFSVDKDAVSLTAEALTISGEGGTVLRGTLHTPIVSAHMRKDLVLESLNKAVHAVTPAGVIIQSRAGGIMASSSDHISLLSVDGSIKLESSYVLIPSLRQPKLAHRVRKHHHHTTDRIYQLCICRNGDLYLAESDTFCDTGVNRQICQS